MENKKSNSQTYLGSIRCAMMGINYSHFNKDLIAMNIDFSVKKERKELINET